MKVNREFVTENAVYLIKLAVTTDFVEQRPLNEIYSVCDKIVPELKEYELEDADELIEWLVDTVDENEKELVESVLQTKQNVTFTDLIEGLYNFLLMF